MIKLEFLRQNFDDFNCKNSLNKRDERNFF